MNSKFISRFKLKSKYLLLFILIIISIFSVGLARSKYLSKVTLSENLEIAKPIVELESVSDTTISDLLPGDSIEYYFNIKNTDNNFTNEVLMNYYIKVLYQNTELPLTYKLYDITSGTDVPIDTSSGNQTGLISLGYEEIENHKYKIIFTWPSDQNDVAYANKELAIDIEVYAEQIIN